MSLLATRRRLLGCLAAVPVLGRCCVASAEPADPVADLARRVAEAEALWAKASVTEDDLLTLWSQRKPEPPEGLFFRPLDWTFGFGAGTRRSDGRRWHGALESVDRLRRQQTKQNLNAREGDALLVPDPKAQARADEILAAYDGWIEECNRLGDELGVAAASGRASDLLAAYRELLGELVRTPAATLAGMLAKAHYGASLFDCETEETFFDDENDPASERIAFSIVRDLLALQGRV